MKIGDQINVLLPWYIQCVDDTEPFVLAVIVDIRDDAVQVEYYSNSDERNTYLWIDMDNLAYTQEMK
jgi:hypothetical protein